MRRLILPAALALLTTIAFSAQPAMAKPTFVKGASCKACHAAMPAKKTNLTPKAADMLKKYKTADCKNCHGAAAGKLTTTTPAKK
ncbi:MAG: hypothetical protein FJZ01_07840 [Candidatus Sericytochromatia bacterium]|nr:hypothetical protein [Candidatus Tanganyikabacteria bacterium]